MCAVAMLRSLLAVCLLFFAIAPSANAQWAVVDVNAIAQLTQQLNTMRQQLTTAQNQLQQARRDYESITGNRGMEALLSGQQRNYIPGQWRDVAAMLDGAGAFRALAGELQRLVADNAVLSEPQLLRLDAADRALLDTSRRSTAMMQVITREALQRSGDRFGTLQQLVDAIRGAADQKAVLDLQARIQAEQNMLLNEATKLQVMYQLAQAEESARAQRTREQAIAAHGSFRNLPPMRLPR
jgi:type IV secretion system protein VirB5